MFSMTSTALAPATLIDPAIPADIAGWLTWAGVPGHFTATADPEHLLHTAPTGRRYMFEGAGTPHLTVSIEDGDWGRVHAPGCGPYPDGSRESVTSLFEDARFAVATQESYAALNPRLATGADCEVRLIDMDGSVSGGFEMSVFLEVVRDGVVQDEDDPEMIFYDYANRRLCMTIDGGAPANDLPANVAQLREIIRDTATTSVSDGEELVYMEGVMEALLAAVLQHAETPQWVHEAVALR